MPLPDPPHMHNHESFPPLCQIGNKNKHLRASRLSISSHGTQCCLIGRSVGEEETDTLSVVGSSDGLSEGGADVDDSELLAGLELVLAVLARQRYGVSDDDVLEHAVVDVLNGLAAENAVRDDGYDLGGTVGHDRLSCLAESTAGIGHVIDQNSNLVLYVSDEHHARDFVGACALLVDQGETKVQTVSYRRCSAKVLAHVE
jgi:hypothetical protein